MNLPEGFQFSQYRLQDFADCRRRFLLRHVWQLAWPAVESEPIHEHERYLQQGADFHRLAQQLFVGIPVERLEAGISDPQLLEWWENFLPRAGELIESQHSAGWKLYPETSLSASMAERRLMAKYDLLAATQDRLLIYDWKTGRAKPSRRWLEKRLQTRVYPYLLSRAGHQLNEDQPVPADRIEMVYWFANHPDQIIRIPYSSAAYRADEAYLTDMVETIQRLEESEFHLTADEKRCAYCIYRSLCDRGVSAGSLSDLWDEADDEVGFSLDFEQIAEIEF
jgi:CRISPR/Cas system-associated exonuclease Cas4 (RecB family)